MLEMICEKSGVEIGEEWEGSDGNTYKITEDGDLKIISNGQCLFKDSVWGEILTGKLKPVWKPKDGEKYYVPDIPWENEDDRYSTAVWFNESMDQFRFKNNLVYRTKEEAIEAANQMLQLWKER